tara:strand:- start:1156 stop:1464 length:309 start_codon:yes stop_codon:yes gene_type:complete
MDWGKLLKGIGKGALRVAGEANPVLGMVGPLVDAAEDTFGKGAGADKKEFVFSSIKGMLLSLDQNDSAEFGVTDWAMFLDAVDQAIEVQVKIRKSTNWWDKK